MVQSWDGRIRRRDDLDLPAATCCFALKAELAGTHGHRRSVVPAGWIGNCPYVWLDRLVLVTLELAGLPYVRHT